MVKDKATLDSYAKSQERNKKNIAYHPTSARQSKSSIEGKTLLARKPNTPSMGVRNTQSPFGEYVQTVSYTYKQHSEKSDSGPVKLAEVLHTKESLAKALEAEKLRNSKDFRIRKGSGVRDKKSDINQFLKKNKYARIGDNVRYKPEFGLLSENTGERYLEKHNSDTNLIQKLDAPLQNKQFLETQRFDYQPMDGMQHIK